MRDRQPTKVLENGALRYGVYDETGALLRYEYLALEDAPSDVGTDLSKANLLTDDTETALFGSAADRTINDAFAGLAVQIKLIKDDVASITLTLKDSAGTAIPGVLVQGILSENGQAVYSNTSGVAAGYIPEGSQTIKVTGYADIVDYTETISVTKGTTINKAITLTTRNFLKITSSRSIKFSSNVNTVDVNPVGAGGGAGNWICQTLGGDSSASGGAGGGGYSVKQTGLTVTPNTSYPAIIGAGGEAGSAGGASSFMGVSAAGGNAGGNAYISNNECVGGNGGIGNGNGGSGGARNRRIVGGVSQVVYDDGEAGSTGTQTMYSSFSGESACGGGGGVGCIRNSGSGSSGGSPGGGAGGNFGGGSDSAGVNGTNGVGGGAGSGAIYTAINSSDDAYLLAGNPGKGGSGCVAIRMHLKSAA